MTQHNPLVDGFIQNATKWQQEFELLRSIVQTSELSEELKWGVPCYTLNDKNVVLMHGFKEYCALLFIKGALLSDPLKRLIQQTQNVQAGRQLRFTNVREILSMKANIESYLQEAISVEKAGIKVEFKSQSELDYPEEFQKKLDEIPELKMAFEALTPGRRRAYLLHFSEPIQAKTRENRIEKYVSKILDGKGIFD